MCSKLALLSEVGGQERMDSLRAVPQVPRPRGRVVTMIVLSRRDQVREERA